MIKDCSVSFRALPQTRCIIFSGFTFSRLQRIHWAVFSYFSVLQRNQATTMGKHIVLLGFPAFGHMIPFISLAKKLSAAGSKVTLAASAAIVSSLRKRGNLCAADEKQFDTFGIEDGIAEADTGMIWPKVWSHVIPGVEKYVESLSRASESGGNSDNVDVIVADAFVTRAASASKKRGIPFYMFFTSPILSLNIFLCMDENTPDATASVRTRFLQDGAGLKRGEVDTPTVIYIKKIGLDVGRTINDLKGVLVNSFRELKGGTVEHFLSNTGRNDLEIYCIGPVFPEEPERTPEEEAVRDQVRHWLDNKKPATVTYVSFGSIVVSDPAQVAEIGKALLQLGAPFIYSIRTENQVHLPEEMRTSIPEQLGRPDSPWLVLNWAPQDLILNHSAVQVFVTHCGWNSTVESMSAKKPTCMWPIFGDQMENARVMKRCGMGLLATGEGEHYKSFINAGELQQKIREVGGWNKDASSGVQSEKSPFAIAAELWGEKIREAVGPTGSSQEEFGEFLHRR